MLRELRGRHSTLSRAAWVCVLLGLLGVGCSADGEGWDYRWGIQKDVRNLTRPDCPPGQHLDLACKQGSVGQDCPEVCVPNEKK